MLKTFQTILKQTRESYRVPKTVQDLIPITRIWADGIFLCGKSYTKSWRYTDINYKAASRPDKEHYFLTWSGLLNGLDTGAIGKFTSNNRRLNMTEFGKKILIPYRTEGLEEYNREINKVLYNKAQEADGNMQEKYVTVTIFRRNIEEARNAFRRIDAELKARFRALGSTCTEMDAQDRLKVLYGFYRYGEDEDYCFDLKDSQRHGHSFKDYICPDSIERHSDYMVIGKRYVRSLYLKDYANYIGDDIVDELMSLNRNMMLSIDVIPIPTDEAVTEVEKKLLGIETNAMNWQRRQNKNNNFTAVLPYDMESQRNETREFLRDLTTRDQRMMLSTLTMVITADSKEQLDQDTETLISLTRKRMCQLAVLKYQQMDGMNTALPIGTWLIHAVRTLTTESVAVFMPFRVQEIMDPGGMYFGQNAISHNMILVNKELLQNQSAFYLGVPGSGKSFLTKFELLLTALSTDDDILICDPEGEYTPLIEAMGDMAEVIHVAAGGKDRLNAMYMVEGYGENDPVVMKSEFILSLIEQIDKRGVGPQQKSIIDRCIRRLYQTAREQGTVPTLCTLRDYLLEQPEPEAKDIALSLELYTDGSLDIFGKQSNVDMDKRIISFDIHDLGTQLKQTGLLVITDTILNRVSLNWRKGKRTHVVIDEFHVVFENEYSAQFFNSAWRQFRKRNAYPTAITQNVEYLLDSVQASTMLSNSEFIVMLNQAASDREKLGKLLNISQEQMGYITNAAPGSGLIRYGGSLVPFVNNFPKDTKTYQLLSTKPGEGAFSGLGIGYMTPKKKEMYDEMLSELNRYAENLDATDPGKCGKDQNSEGGEYVGYQDQGT